LGQRRQALCKNGSRLLACQPRGGLCRFHRSRRIEGFPLRVGQPGDHLFRQPVLLGWRRNQPLGLSQGRQQQREAGALRRRVLRAILACCGLGPGAARCARFMGAVLARGRNAVLFHGHCS
jgi:hypothetical protein